jgi:outer membrane protein assembly factor BamA
MSKATINPLWIGLLIGTFLSSCNTTKFLDVDQFLLKKNQLILHADEKIPNKGLLTYEMETLYKQKPNTKLFFLFPREWFWFKTNATSDTSGFNRWQRRVLSEPPAIFDESLSIQTAEEIAAYLNNKGYFNAEVIYEEYIRQKKIGITYHVYPKKRTYIDSTVFHSSDRVMDSLLQAIKPESFLKKGDPLDSRLYDLEKERIALNMRNRGYANFFSNYVAQLLADTTGHAYRALISLEVLPPLEDTVHHDFKVGKIIVFPNYTPEQESGQGNIRDTLVQGLIFRDAPAVPLYFKDEVLLRAVKTRTGQPFRQTDIEATQQDLAASGVFKFVRIKQVLSSRAADELDIQIFLTPNPRLELGTDLEVSFTNRAISGGSLNLLGLSLRPSIRNRNIFNGAETLVSSVRMGGEFSVGGGRFINTIDVGFQNDLYFPRFKDYFGFWKSLHLLPLNQRKKRAGQDFYSLLQNNANTKFSLGYNYTDFVKFYSWNIFNFSYGFELSQGKQRNYRLSHLAADYFNPTLTDTFKLSIKSNFLEKSLEDRFIFSLFFREFNYNFLGKTDARGNTFSSSFNFETAGSELDIINQITNAITGRKDTFKIDSVKFAQYARLETALRYYKQFTPKTSLAARLGFGIVRPFGASEVVPYLKQFGIGGPNSVRAWPARGLGPGGFIDTAVINRRSTNNLNLFRTGDLWLEANLEYRFNIYWRLNGALFLDAGNVWTFDDAKDTPGAPFFFQNPNRVSESPVEGQYDPFYKQIAVGSGFGLRLDLTYFIFRLDLGMKLRYPYRWDGEHFWNPPERWFKRMNLNLGLGMPF